MVTFTVETLEKVREEIKNKSVATKSHLYSKLKIKYPTLDEILKYLCEKGEIESVELETGNKIYKLKSQSAIMDTH